VSTVYYVVIGIHTKICVYGRVKSCVLFGSLSIIVYNVNVLTNSLVLHMVNTHIHTEQDFWTGINESKNE
jgi:hypothetical protein